MKSRRSAETSSSALLPRWLGSLAAIGLLASAPAFAAGAIKGRVLGAGAPIVGSTVTLWAAGAGAATQLAQAQTNAEGGFELNAETKGADVYVVATGGRLAAGGENPAIALMTVLGTNPPDNVVVNEMTTVASVFTHNQFIVGAEIKGPALSLKIAAANVPNFVDLVTGGWGDAIQGTLNGGQTPTMANFATLADLLAGCVAQMKADACGKLYAAATGPDGKAPHDTLTATEAIAKYPWYQPERLFALIDDFYPIPEGKNLRSVPFMPYLKYAPSAWVLPLKFDGGGYLAGGKAMFDSQGNLWVGDNFTTGWQGQDSLWQGNATKFAPDGHPLSPITTGFAGGGMEGGTFGAAVDARDNAWLSNYGSKSIAIFDKNGKPLTPPDGITFGGRLGLMQGVIVTPSGDVWAVGISKDQLLYFPKGDWTNGRIVCEGQDAEPCKSFAGAFHLGIDQQDRIWVTQALGAWITRFPATDPNRVERFDTGYSGSGLGIDSQGNVWLSNRFGNSSTGKATLGRMVAALKSGGEYVEVMARAMHKQKGGPDGGSVTLLRPDGTEYPGSPFTGGSLPAPFAATIDGNDNVWVSNFAGANSPITELCGARTENCPPGFKTGDPISPPGGYVGGGLQMQTDLAIGPAGDVWVINNWQDIDSCFGAPDEALSTRCGGQGVVVFFGMAKPVRAPQIGPAQPME
jgi:hypothetical protein